MGGARKRVVVSESKTYKAGLSGTSCLPKSSPQVQTRSLSLTPPTNRAGQTLGDHTFGYGIEELLGQSIDVLIPDSRKDRHVEHLRRFFEVPHPREMGVGLDLAGRRRDGIELPIDVSLTPVTLGDDLYVAAFVRDARERRRVLSRLNAVNEITERLLTGAKMREILPLVAQSARLLCNSDAAWIVMPETATEFEIVSADGKGTELLIGLQLPADTSRSAEVMRSGQPDC